MAKWIGELPNHSKPDQIHPLLTLGSIFVFLIENNFESSVFKARSYPYLPLFNTKMHHAVSGAKRS